MSLAKFVSVYQKGISGIVFGKELTEELKNIEYDAETVLYVIEEIQSQRLKLNSDKLNVLMKVVYVFPSKDFTESIVELLEFSFGLSNDDLFSVISEIEFSFTVLGMIKDHRAIPVLERFINEPPRWDEGNLVKAANYGILKIKS